MTIKHLCPECRAPEGSHKLDCSLHPLNSAAGKPRPKNTLDDLRKDNARLQAELAAETELRKGLVDLRHALRRAEHGRENRRNECIAAQSELTKARELIKESDDFLYVLIGHDSFARISHQHGKPWYEVVNDLRKKLCGFLAHQSAPAAKCVTCEGSGVERTDGAGHVCTACNGSGEAKPC